MKTKLWTTGTTDSLDFDVEKYTVGNDSTVDKKLIGYDIMATIAHSEMLVDLKILTTKEQKLIKKSLNDLSLLTGKDDFTLEGFEDCHSYIEAYLIEHAGESGKKIHTARSRNDQSLTMMRLYIKESIKKHVEQTHALKQKLNFIAEKYSDIAMPGYTHMQKAMPTTVCVWLSAYYDALQDSVCALDATLSSIDQNPLGSGAGFGSSFNIDREITTKSLGFAKTQENPMYCGLSRGYFELMCLQSMNLSMVIIGKLMSDLLLFTTQEFCFFSLPEKYTTGSSIMPHKHNYDVLEIARGKCHIFWSHQQKVQSIYGSIGSGYQRDLQLTKEIFVEAFEEAEQTIEIVTKIIGELEVHKDCLEKSITPEMQSVTHVNELVKTGENFRDAYKIIKKRL